MQEAGGASGPWLDVAGVDDIPDGGSLAAMAGTEPILLARVAGEVFAMDRLCPHKFTSLEGGQVENGCITCPLHEASFDLHSGRPGAGDEWAGSLPMHEVRVVDGRVLVRLSTL